MLKPKKRCGGGYSYIAIPHPRQRIVSHREIRRAGHWIGWCVHPTHMHEGRGGLYHGVFSMAEGKKGMIQGDADVGLYLKPQPPQAQAPVMTWTRTRSPLSTLRSLVPQKSARGPHGEARGGSGSPAWVEVRTLHSMGMDRALSRLMKDSANKISRELIRGAWKAGGGICISCWRTHPPPAPPTKPPIHPSTHPPTHGAAPFAGGILVPGNGKTRVN